MIAFKRTCMALVVIGGLNWGCYGLFGFDLVGWLFGGSMTWPARTIFILVGIAAICLVPYLFMSVEKIHEDGAP